MSPTDRDPKLAEDVAQGLRSVREAARREARAIPGPPPGEVAGSRAAPLAPLEEPRSEPLPASPDREELNALWDVSAALSETGTGALLARLLGPLRGPLQRLVRFALGPVVERQVRMNSAQVRFDNEVVRYLDDRVDRMSRHYDEVLGLHGKRMEEIDERHRILQQELIRHVHDLVQRIDYVFETAEQNHLYLEGMLRESREELLQLAQRLDSMAEEQR